MATYSDQFYLFDPANPPSAGSSTSYVNYNLVDQNNDGDFDRRNNDSVNGSDIQSSWAGDTVTINVPGVGNVTYTGTTFYLANGQRVFTPSDGQVLKNGTFVSSTYVNTEGPLLVPQLGPACFTAGTRIRVPGGAERIERLRPGDLVETLDHGAQVLRWIGRRKVNGTDTFAPIRIEAKVLGNSRPLLVSPQHRMLMVGWRSQLALGEAEILVAAKHLVGMAGVRKDPVAEVDYVHLLFDRHEIVFAEDAPSESFHPASQMLGSDRALYLEIMALFPGRPHMQPGARRGARRVATAYEARVLAAGHGHHQPPAGDGGLGAQIDAGATGTYR